ncbi:MAG: hypothetical protein GY762_12750 [Proteobacteria bacterium]|nr:hypothetical protein [Pseudomonadota bacterium]
MTENKNRLGDLKHTVVHICPACGVVNPAGPSETCRHLQLAKFEGVDDDLGELLADVAAARSQYVHLAGELKRRVKLAVRNQEAEIETPRKVRPSELDELQPEPGVLSLVLENPDPPPPPKAAPETKRIRKRKLQGPQAVDPRQLDLIAREPPKGDA